MAIRFDKDKFSSMQYELYSGNFKRIHVVLYVVALIVVVEAAFLLYLVMNPAMADYYTVMPDGKVSSRPVATLNAPLMDKSAILSWARQAVVTAYTFDFYHLRYYNQVENARPYFTTNGWNDFVKALKSSSRLKSLENKKVIVSAVSIGPAVLLGQLNIDGVENWRVQIPLLVSYESASQTLPERILVTVLIKRVSPLDSPEGIGIEQLVQKGGAGLLSGV